MENVSSERGPIDSSPRQVGRFVLSIAAAYVGLELGQELFNTNIPGYLEVGLATAIGSFATTAST